MSEKTGTEPDLEDRLGSADSKSDQVEFHFADATSYLGSSSISSNNFGSIISDDPAIPFVTDNAVHGYYTFTSDDRVMLGVSCGPQVFSDGVYAIPYFPSKEIATDRIKRTWAQEQAKGGSSAEVIKSVASRLKRQFNMDPKPLDGPLDFYQS